VSVDPTSAPRLNEAVSRWDVGTPRAFRTPDTGTINQTRIVDTDTGRFVLRLHAYGEPERLRMEHALLQWVSERGIPAPGPVVSREGSTWTEIDGSSYAIFPFASGRQISRADLADEQVAEMGRFLADLHQVLEAYPVERVRQRRFAVAPDLALQEIDRLARKIRQLKSTDSSDGWALDRLEGRRDYIHSAPGGALDAFENLAFQTTHGDYQESNLFFRNGRVSAIIDWEQAYAAPPGYEVMRMLHLALRFDPARCLRFLSAYRDRRELPLSELDICAAAYAVLRGHSLWLFEELYDKGNERMRRFMNPGPFVPVEEQWASVRDALRN
jgi:homoserine kinase type II